ncbi:MAG: ABC transporter C-terminal domain-containing protein, partial [Candidatus Eisenbacteria bacterium]
APAGGKAAADAAHHPGGESREHRAARQKRQKDQSRVERDIETRETRMKAIEAELADPDVYANVARSKGLIGEYDKLKTELTSLWQKLEMLG